MLLADFIGSDTPSVIVFSLTEVVGNERNYDNSMVEVNGIEKLHITSKHSAIDLKVYGRAFPLVELSA